MKETIVSARNSVIKAFYKAILKPVYFANDPEKVHDRMVAFGAKLGKSSFACKALYGFFGYSNSILEQNVLGIDFKNPIGLAAGFDKNADLVDVLPSVGFGYMEVGSITGKPCEGNPKPRLWRLPKSKGLVVYYGLKNDGCEVLSKKITAYKKTFPVGTSVAMTNCKENLDIKNAIDDYAKAFKAFADIGDYTTINISCPNAQGGQPFIEPHKLDYLLDIIDAISTKKPVFVKLSPDMDDPQIDALLDVLRKHRIQGVIATNLTKKKNNPKIHDPLPGVGGVSGKPVQELSDALVEHIYRREGKRFVIVGCGGVFNAEDAYRKIRNGATLIQMITGMIFEGPQVISETNKGLVALLKRDGYKNISEAVGADVRKV